MQLRSVVELAALVSAHSPLVVEARSRPPKSSLARFWCASRARLHVSTRRLSRLEIELLSAGPDGVRRACNRARVQIADVLAGELLTRVWGAVLTATDRANGRSWCGPLARTLLGHQQKTRNLLLRVLANEPWGASEQLLPCDRLRRLIERWTDVLIGHLVERYDVDEFAYDRERAREFGLDQLRDGGQPPGVRVWDLYLVSLRSSFPEFRLPDGRQGVLRDDLIHAMLGCFSDELFDDAGVLHSPLVRRLLDSGRQREELPEIHRKSAVSAPRGRWN